MVAKQVWPTLQSPTRHIYAFENGVNDTKMSVCGEYTQCSLSPWT